MNSLFVCIAVGLYMIGCWADTVSRPGSPSTPWSWWHPGWAIFVVSLLGAIRAGIQLNDLDPGKLKRDLDAAVTERDKLREENKHLLDAMKVM